LLFHFLFTFQFFSFKKLRKIFQRVNFRKHDLNFWYILIYQWNVIYNLLDLFLFLFLLQILNVSFELMLARISIKLWWTFFRIIFLSNKIFVRIRSLNTSLWVFYNINIYLFLVRFQLVARRLAYIDYQIIVFFDIDLIILNVAKYSFKSFCWALNDVALCVRR